jgi:hypothetical protein
MSGVRGFFVCLSVIALSACGGGGGAVPGVPSSSAASPLISAGTLLAGPAANFMDSADSFSFTANAVVTSAAATNAAQVRLATDSTGKTRFLTLNVPLGNGASYVHTFDLATAKAGSGPLLGFIGVNDGTMFPDGSTQHGIVLDPSLSFSSYGFWVNVQSFDATTGETGALGGIAFGNLTPASGMPTTGSASYSGRTVGAAVDGTTQSLLAGTVNINANFGAMSVSGTFVINDVTSGIPTSFATLTMPATAIAPGAGGAYNGTLVGALPGGAVTGSAVQGHFYGPQANETAGTWSAKNSVTTAVGGFGAKR